MPQPGGTVLYCTVLTLLNGSITESTRSLTRPPPVALMDASALACYVGAKKRRRSKDSDKAREKDTDTGKGTATHTYAVSQTDRQRVLRSTLLSLLLMGRQNWTLMAMDEFLGANS